MSELTRLIIKKERLEKQLKKLDSQLIDVPEGSLIIKRDRDGADGEIREKYFHKINGKKIYIQKDNLALAKQLSAKKMNMFVRDALEKELALVEYTLKNYVSADDAIYDFYNKHPGNARLMRESLPTISEQVQKIISAYKMDEDYRPEERTVPTTKGERVRSKSEASIANALYARDDLIYVIEPKISTIYNGKTYILHPDFLIVDLTTGTIYIWDHCGIMESDSYYDKVVFTNSCYRASGFIQGKNLIQTFETKNCALTEEEIQAEIHRFFGVSER